jgi:hypothetical protein
MCVCVCVCLNSSGSENRRSKKGQGYRHLGFSNSVRFSLARSLYSSEPALPAGYGVCQDESSNMMSYKIYGVGTVHV